MAAPIKYNPDYHDDWAWSLANKGATDTEIAIAFHVSVRTIHRWKKDYESFAYRLEEGKNYADAKVERKLYERALGFKVEEKEKIVEIDPKTGEAKPIRVKTTIKNIVPDTMAQMYWLNNRNRSEWAQRQEDSSDPKDCKNDVMIYMPEKDGGGNG